MVGAGAGGGCDFENPIKRHGAEVQAEDCRTWTESGADTEAQGGREQPARLLQLALS